MVFLLHEKFGLFALLLLRAGGALAAPANTTSPSTNTTTAEGPSNATAPLINGRCKWKWADKAWTCPRKGFECINYVCVDKRTPEQKEADKQEKADGKDGRCLFTYDIGNYTCTQRGFECQDNNCCIDHRTPEEKAADEKIQAKKDAQTRKDDLEKAKWGNLAGAIAGGIVCAGIILGVIIRCFGGKPRTKRPDAETVARAVEAEVRKVRESLPGVTNQQPPKYVSM